MTAVQIANMALDLLSETEIQSLTENNKAARAMNRQLPNSRQILLEEIKPEFAKKTQALSNDVATPTHPRFTLQSTLPDHITILALWDGNPDLVTSKPIPEEYWDREGQKILHDLETPVLEFIQDVTDYSLMGPKFSEALAYHLAAHTARKITGNDTIGFKLLEVYTTDKLPTAQMREGQVKRVGKNLSIYDSMKRSPMHRSRFSPRISG